MSFLGRCRRSRISVNFFPKEPVPPVTKTTESCQFMPPFNYNPRADSTETLLPPVSALLPLDVTLAGHAPDVKRPDAANHFSATTRRGTVWSARA
jgi:hypothetical protein